MKFLKVQRVKKWVVVLSAVTIVFSCVKGDDPLISFEGRVLTYVGPFDSQLINRLDELELSPAVGITVQMYKGGEIGFLGFQDTDTRLDEFAVTDAEGNYSFMIRSESSDGYYPKVVKPENFDSSTSKGGYSARKVYENRVVFTDIILTDYQYD